MSSWSLFIVVLSVLKNPHLVQSCKSTFLCFRPDLYSFSFYIYIYDPSHIKYFILCEVLGVVPFFLYVYPVVPAPFIKDSPLVTEMPWYSVETQLTINVCGVYVCVCVCVCACVCLFLDSLLIHLFHLSILAPMLYCFDYCRFTVSLKTR